jgi:hypothetical protein
MNVVGPDITIEDYDTGRAKPIDVFEGRIKGWVLAFAEIAKKHDSSGIAVLLLTSSVLEPLGGVLPPLDKGRSSKAKFCNGFVRAFPEVPGSNSARQVAEEVYELLRNGLFHEAFIKAGIVLTSQDRPVLEKDGRICIDPSRFFDAVNSAFSEVCNEIRSAEMGAPIRQSFDFYWNQKEGEQAKKLEAMVTPGAEYPPVFGTSGTARPVSGTCGTLPPEHGL